LRIAVKSHGALTHPCERYATRRRPRVRPAYGGNPYAGERLYRIVSKGASRQLRPARDFDFVD